MKFRPRLPDGSLGQFEEVFGPKIDETTKLLLEALAGQQEQIEALQSEFEELKGGKE
ncbi:hypothetical protein [Viridibacillus arvi]|uniref:hypothetical protein n=1 Tax=Viridibacillus arvi TaxID=263475 RepID=UPI0034CD6EFD